MSYDLSYRSFSQEDQTRLIEILQQWKTLQDEFEHTVYGSNPTDGPDIGVQTDPSMPTPTPAG